MIGPTVAASAARLAEPDYRWHCDYALNQDAFLLAGVDPRSGVYCRKAISCYALSRCPSTPAEMDLIAAVARSITLEIRKFLMNRTAVLLGGPSDLTRMAVPSFPPTIRVPQHAAITRAAWTGRVDERYAAIPSYVTKEAIYVRTVSCHMSDTEIYEYEGTR